MLFTTKNVSFKILVRRGRYVIVVSPTPLRLPNRTHSMEQKSHSSNYEYNKLTERFFLWMNLNDDFQISITNIQPRKKKLIFSNSYYHALVPTICPTQFMLLAGSSAVALARSRQPHI
jgi:hypothetical protein